MVGLYALPGVCVWCGCVCVWCVCVCVRAHVFRWPCSVSWACLPPLTLPCLPRACGVPVCVQMALQRELGLPVDADIPMYGFIGRLDYQKGVDLIRDSFDWLMNERVQLVLLGSCREWLQG